MEVAAAFSFKPKTDFVTGKLSTTQPELKLNLSYEKN